jgi:outer membrane protein TolC
MGSIRFIFILLIIFTASSLISAAEFCPNQGPKKSFKISLEDAIKTAFEQNPDIKASINEIKLKKIEHKESLSHFMPEITFYTEYVTGDAPSSYLFKTIDQRKLPQNTDFNDPGSFDNFETGISAKMRLYNGGRTKNYVEMTKKGINAQKDLSNETKNMVAFAIISVWYDVLYAKDMVEIANDAYKTAAEQVRVIKVKFDGGGALRSDLLSLKARLSSAKENLISAENNLRIIKSELSTLIGLDPEMEIFIKDGDLNLDINDKDYNLLLHRALKNRPAYNAAKKRVAILSLNLKRAKNGYLPTIDFKADYYHDDSELGYSMERQNWNAGVVFGWNIFDGFSTKSGIEKAETELETAKLKKRKILLNIKKEVRKAYFNMELAKQKLVVANEFKKEARASFDLVKKQFEGGSVDITRYLESELSSNRAKTASSKAFFENKKARASMAKAIGNLYSIEN